MQIVANMQRLSAVPPRRDRDVVFESRLVGSTCTDY